MKKAILGKKLGMTQIFMPDGSLVPVTVIQAGPCTVVQKKTNEKDGYEAVQFGFDDLRRKARRRSWSTSPKWAISRRRTSPLAAICASSAWMTPRPTR